MSNPCLVLFVSKRHRWISLSGEDEVGAGDRLRRISQLTILGLGEPLNTNSNQIRHKHRHRSDNIQTWIERKQWQTILTCGEERMAMAEVLNVPLVTPAELVKGTPLFKPRSFTSFPALPSSS
mmetsp:Transcript_40149/g.72330  ORF Transcript_40149/g.72330 Transcript_40149/m.72330 type:complete len:123 (-) Transcript_40149:106-474(-)